jgi:hypothetical protein
MNEPGWVHVSVMAHAGYLPGGSGKGTGGVLHSFYWRRKFICIQGVGLGGVGWSWLEIVVLSMCLYAAKNGCGNQTILVPDNCLAWSRLGLSTKNSSGRQL